MAQSIYLTDTEKKEMTRWLARRAIVSGWTFIGLPLFVLLVAGTIRFLNPPTFEYTAEDIVALFTLPVIMISVGIWLLRRKQAIRRWFDEPLEGGNGRILSIQPLPYATKRLTLKIEHQPGESYEAKMSYIGVPNWQVGAEIELIFWKNGRYCPRHFDHLVDVAYLPTLERKRKMRNRIVGFVIGYLLLTGLGLLMGLYSQG